FYIMLLTPFVCAMSLPELRTKRRNVMLFWRRRHPVGPLRMATMIRVKVDRIGGQATANV
ncbi:unnamed protein product, partial [Adineta steineri]